MSQEHPSQRETLKNILNDILKEKEDGSPVSSLNVDTSLTNDLGLDSLDLAEMTVRLEDQYGVDVFEDDVVDEVDEVIEKL
jgi:acyl carrier protein